MGKPSRVSVAINFGRQDKTDAKHAPFGVLKSAKNLRHRKAAGLGMRNGYQLAGSSTITGTLVAYDLHEYQGRLLALGSDQLEGYPHDLLEFTGLANQAWRSAQGNGNRFSVSPFTNAREVAGVPQIQGGVNHADAASGGGYTLLLYRNTVNLHTYVTIADSRTNQTVHFQDISNASGLLSFERVAFSGGVFYLLASKTSDNSIILLSFTVGVSSAFGAFATVDAANGSAVTAADLVPVSRNSTAVVCTAFDRGAATNLNIQVWQANGSQLGGTIAVAGTTTSALSLDADQTDNTILLATREAGVGILRSFNFAGTVLAGPTAVLATAATVSVARKNSGVGSDTAFVAGRNGFDTPIVQCAVDTHAGLTTLQTVFNATPTTRLFSFQGPTVSLVLGGLIGRSITIQSGTPSPTAAAPPTLFDGSAPNLTNVLFHVGPSTVHAMVRDYLLGPVVALSLLQNLCLDATIGSLAWCSVHQEPGTIGVNRFPTVTLVDYRSTARQQAVNYGGLRYYSGAAPWIYDGRAATEIGFFEPPTIVSVTPDSSAGSLTPLATYSYVAHWEVTYADGSFIESAPSLPQTVVMGAGNTENSVVVTGPHTLRSVLGGSALGASVTLVISRTEWSPTTLDPVSGVPGSQFSVYRRSKEIDLTADVSLYGQNQTVVDTTADSVLGQRGAIYTQSDRGEFSGPVEHNAVESCSYIAACAGRIHTGGLVRPFEFQTSLEAFIGQPFAWSFLSNFYGQASKAIVGVFALGNSRIIFTSDEIYGLGPNAPDDEGKGSLDLPVRISSPGGLKDWRSLVEEPDGLWFQLDDDKLFKLPLGGFAQASPAWAGKDIQLLLASFPIITAATKHKGDNVSLFACNNAALTSAQIAVHDMLFDSWLTDSPPLQPSKGIEAMVGFGRTVGYVSGGIVYTQTTGFTDLTANFIDCQAVLQPIYPFGLGGYGLIYELVLTAEYRGDCQLTISASYDDGVTFPFTTTFVVSGLTVGATVRKKWTLPQDQTDSIVLKVDINTNGAPSEGLILNEITLYGEDQGGSPELPPGDQA